MDIAKRCIPISLVFFISAFFIFISGCSVPQIVLIDDPLTPGEHLQLGLSYENRNQLELAKQQYQKAADHGVPEAFLFMGNVAYLQKDYPEAERLYKRTIKKMPHDPRAYNNLAWIYYQQKKNMDQALTLACKAVELAPSADQGAYRDTLEKILSVKNP